MTGRPSIPETSKLEPISRGVLDRPLELVIGRRLAPTRWRAMTIESVAYFQAHALASRRATAPELMNDPPSKEQRVQGKPGAQCTRSLACESKKHTSIVTTGTPVSPGLSLRVGFNGL
jgi:hypothetical protein